MGAPNTGTGNTREEILKDIRNILAKEGNGRVCVGYQTVSVSNSAVSRLTVPGNANSAEVTVVSAGSTDANSAIRYTIDNLTIPVTGGYSNAGVDLGDFSTVEILSNFNLSAFRAIAVDAANTKYLKVHYFA